MASQETDRKYLKVRLDKADTSDLLKKIKERSGVTWPILEAAFVLGTGTAGREKGGNSAGNTIQQYAAGKRTLPIAVAKRILDTAIKKGWLTGEDEATYRWKLLADDMDVDRTRFERDLIKDIEPHVIAILNALLGHPDLTPAGIEAAVDLVVVRMFKQRLGSLIDSAPYKGPTDFSDVFQRSS